MQFKVGDEVEFGGMFGTVRRIYNVGSEYKVHCCFGGHDNICFTEDGRFHLKQTVPLLKLINRPKPKVKKTVYVNYYKDIVDGNAVGFVYTSEAVAKKNGIIGTASTVAYPVEIEVEE